MDDDCEIVGELKPTVISPLMKSLKQSRLPFAPLDSKSPQKTTISPNQKKRRLSGSSVSASSRKTARSEKKQKTTKQKKIKGNETKEDNLKQNRKRSRNTLVEKKLESRENEEKARGRSCKMTSDDEVSSSVDDDVEVPKAKKKPAEVVQKRLATFLCKKPTQQAEISTSTEDPSNAETGGSTTEDVDKIKKTRSEKCVVLKNGNNSDESEEIEINGRKEELHHSSKGEEKNTDGDKANKATDKEILTRETAKNDTGEKKAAATAKKSLETGDNDVQCLEASGEREKTERIDTRAEKSLPEEKTGKTGKGRVNIKKLDKGKEKKQLKGNVRKGKQSQTRTIMKVKMFGKMTERRMNKKEKEGELENKRPQVKRGEKEEEKDGVEKEKEGNIIVKNKEEAENATEGEEIKKRKEEGTKEENEVKNGREKEQENEAKGEENGEKGEEKELEKQEENEEQEKREENDEKEKREEKELEKQEENEEQEKREEKELEKQEENEEQEKWEENGTHLCKGEVRNNMNEECEMKEKENEDMEVVKVDDKVEVKDNVEKEDEKVEEEEKEDEKVEEEEMEEKVEEEDGKEEKDEKVEEDEKEEKVKEEGEKEEKVEEEEMEEKVEEEDEKEEKVEEEDEKEEKVEEDEKEEKVKEEKVEEEEMEEKVEEDEKEEKVGEEDEKEEKVGEEDEKEEKVEEEEMEEKVEEDEKEEKVEEEIGKEKKVEEDEMEEKVVEEDIGEEEDRKEEKVEEDDIGEEMEDKEGEEDEDKEEEGDEDKVEEEEGEEDEVEEEEEGEEGKVEDDEEEDEEEEDKEKGTSEQTENGKEDTGDKDEHGEEKKTAARERDGTIKGRDNKKQPTKRTLKNKKEKCDASGGKKSLKNESNYTIMSFLSKVAAKPTTEINEKSKSENNGRAEDEAKEGEDEETDDIEMVDEDNVSEDMDASRNDEEEEDMEDDVPGTTAESEFSSPSSKPLVSGLKVVSAVKPKKLTPKQLEKEVERLLKKEEREKKRLEREKKKQEELAEKERVRKEKEEERLKQKEEREKLKDAKRQKREEELQRKEEEKRQKEEEKKQKDKAKQVKEKENDKLKNRFASFFVAKKRDIGEMEEESDNGLFMQFRVKEDMRLAPIKRSHLSEDQQMELDSVISSEPSSIRETYLNILKTGSYVMQRCEQTWPPEDKKDEVDDDIEVIEYDDDEGLDNMDGMIEDVVAGKTEGKHVKAKLLSFCENRRPAYWGTWSKKSSTVSARRPLAKDQIFDYEYDSDDDWEEEEAGESLSDSEGEEKEGEEKEEEGDGDQYEVDNDFFVPHGYLSDDEGRSDEEGAQEESVVEDDGTKNKEKLKQKQAEFEEEMKKKTRHLKPRVLGCLWMADKNNNRAYDQLMKLLSPHKVVNLCSRLPIDIRRRGSLPAVVKDQNLEDEPFQDDKTGGKPKYFKTFPEEAIPHLIRLLHGNRNGKIFLSREFSDYWRKKDLEDDNDETTTTMMPSGGYFIAKKKVESKIKELGRWRKCIDEGPLHKVMMWYVPKVVREQYGLGDLSLPNTWNYINKPKERREVNHEDLESVEEGTKTGKLTPITAFAKKLPQTPVSTLNSPAAASTSATPQTSKADKGSPNSGLAVASSPVTTVNSPSCTSPSALIKNPTGKPTPTIKKRGYIFSSPRGQEVTAQQASFASFFKKPEEKFSTEPSADSKKEERSKDGQENEFVCITLE